MVPADSSSTIFVGGFSFDTTASALLAAFTPFGEVLDVQLPSDPNERNPNSKKHRGFGFVTFVEAENALDAIDNMHLNTLPGVTNRGKVLKVNKAKPPKGGAFGQSNKPIWQQEEWLKEHGQDSINEARVDIPEGGDEEMA